MNAAYVDTSCLVAIAFGEPGGDGMRERMEATDVLLSSNLLEAEYRSALHREDVAYGPDALTWLRWVLPDRPLGAEMERVLEVGYVRGADLWHLAIALYVAPAPGELRFLTLDARQEEIARSMGFGA